METPIYKILSELRPRLKRGDIDKIAERTKYARETVSKCLSLHINYYNQKIAEEAVEVIKEREAQTEEFIEKIKSIPVDTFQILSHDTSR